MFGGGSITPDYNGVNTIAEAGLAEMRCIEELLSRMLPRSTRHTPGSTPRPGAFTYS